jgi:hypothetical protein
VVVRVVRWRAVAGALTSVGVVVVLVIGGWRAVARLVIAVAAVLALALAGRGWGELVEEGAELGSGEGAVVVGVEVVEAFVGAGAAGGSAVALAASRHALTIAPLSAGGTLSGVGTVAGGRLVASFAVAGGVTLLVIGRRLGALSALALLTSLTSLTALIALTSLATTLSGGGLLAAALGWSLALWGLCGRAALGRASAATGLLGVAERDRRRQGGRGDECGEPQRAAG